MLVVDVNSATSQNTGLNSFIRKTKLTKLPKSTRKGVSIFNNIYTPSVSQEEDYHYAEKDENRHRPQATQKLSRKCITRHQAATIRRYQKCFLRLFHPSF